MDHDKTFLFCVDADAENSCKEVIEDLFTACHFTTKEVVEELQELSLPAFYMCTIYDNSIVNELQVSVLTTANTLLYNSLILWAFL